MKNLIDVLILFLALPVISRAQSFSSSAIGTTAGDFLNIGVGARAIAMGGAYSAAADDATALYWNPAAMTQVPNQSATVMHMAYIANTSLDYGSYVDNLGKYGAFGVSIERLSLGTIQETDASFNNIGSVSPYDMAFTLGYAYQFADTGFGPLDGFSLGLAGKLIQSQLLSTAETEAMDFGLLSPAYLDDRLRLAFDVQNLGGTLKYEQIPEPLPLALTIGGSYRITSSWLATMDIGLPKGDSPYINLGTEYLLVSDGWWRFSLRGGFNSQTYTNVAGFAGPSVGFGVGYKGFDTDYAFVPYSALGSAQRISLTYGF